MQDSKLVKNLERLYGVGAILLVVLSIVGVLYAINLFREGRLIGANASNTITLSGEGKTTASPDRATITFSVREQTKLAKKVEYAESDEDDKDVKDSKDRIAKKINLALDELNKILDKKDISTETYSSYPRYNYPVNGPGLIDGYDVSQTISVKVVDIKNVSKILDIISKAGINEVSGPGYYIEKDEVFKDKAREEAINDAKRKANILAKQLGVSVLRIVSYTEDSNYVPMTYMTKTSLSGAVEDATTATLPEGENEITSNVTITFEIK